MKEELLHIPEGRLMVETHLPGKKETLLSEGCFGSDSSGRGLIKKHPLFCGIEISLLCFQSTELIHCHQPRPSVLQISHCRQGRMGWTMKTGQTIYLGSGDLSLHMADGCADSEILLPFGFYEGTSLTVDLDILHHHIPEILQDAGISSQQLYTKFCSGGKITAMPASARIDHVFSELYDLPEHMHIPYFKLKVQEILLFLSMLDIKEAPVLTPCFSSQVEIIKEIHSQLVSQPGRRFTIEELSRQYLINTSSLKSIFKTVYGLPIASYMKDYRMREAARLLRETNDSIADIASCVGYESQSKFTQAFKDVFQILPTAYRKQFLP